MRETARDRIVRLIKIAIEKGNYDIIRRAIDIAYSNGIECCWDDDSIMVEDEVFYFKGAF